MERHQQSLSMVFEICPTSSLRCLILIQSSAIMPFESEHQITKDQQIHLGIIQRGRQLHIKIRAKDLDQHAKLSRIFFPSYYTSDYSESPETTSARLRC